MMQNFIWVMIIRILVALRLGNVALVIAAYRAQNLLADRRAYEARLLLERVYNKIRPSMPQEFVYPHVNLIYAVTLHETASIAAATQVYNTVASQMCGSARFPGRPISDDEKNYLLCYIRNMLLNIAGSPAQGETAVAMAINCKAERINDGKIRRYFLRAFPLDLQDALHNEAIACAADTSIGSRSIQ
jgi:hypothetical protein